MTAVTIDLTTMLAASVGVGAAIVAWVTRQARRQTRLTERVNWLATRYAADHDHAVPWDEPVTDGGFPVEAEPDGDVSAPHHLWVGLAITAFGFGSVCSPKG